MLTGYHICYKKHLLLAFKGRCGFSLNNLVELQGCEIISNMYVGKNAKYTKSRGGKGDAGSAFLVPMFMMRYREVQALVL